MSSLYHTYKHASHEHIQEGDLNKKIKQKVRNSGEREVGRREKHCSNGRIYLREKNVNNFGTRNIFENVQRVFRGYLSRTQAATHATCSMRVREYRQNRSHPR